MRKEYILTEEEKQRKRQKIEENRIRKTSITSEEAVTYALLVRTVCFVCVVYTADAPRTLTSHSTCVHIIQFFVDSDRILSLFLMLIITKDIASDGLAIYRLSLGIDRQDLPINSWKIATDRSAIDL